MTAAYSKDLELFVAKQFIESVSEPQGVNVYATIGRCYPWNTETAPDAANTSLSNYYEVWSNMIGGKKITGNDMRHCIPRHNWESGISFYQFDDLIDSRTLTSNTTNFYVVTDEWNVYKCLSNNNNSVCTVKPTSTLTSSYFEASDGYIWKFMYSISSEERLRFVTQDYIPVKTLTINDGSLQWQVQDNAEIGAIHRIAISNTGSGYIANDAYVIIRGDGTSANGYPVRNTVSNTISSIVMDNIGTGYSYANVTIYSSTGTGAAGRAILSPQGGHGSDPLSELGGSNIIVHTLLRSDEKGKLPVTNDYRQLCIIEEPRVYGTTKRSLSNTAFTRLLTMTLSGISAEFVEDEYVFQGSSLSKSYFSARVMEWDSPNTTIKLTNVRGEPTSSLLIGNTSGGAMYINSTTNPDVQPFLGNLLYIDNMVPVTRTIDQIEDFKIILKF